jgi:PST family polysaccharide transporter
MPAHPRRLIDAFRHPVSQNVLALGVIQVLITVLPLVTLPYLARVLSRSELGLVVFAQAFSFVIALLVEYGFALSGTREAATRREDPEALATTVAEVHGAKLLLTLLAAAISLVAWPFVPIFADSPDLLAYGFALGVVQGFFPLWYFLGIERARTLALFQLVSRLLSLLLIVLLVRDKSDGEVVLAIYVACTAGATIAALALAYRQVRFITPTLAGSRKALRRGGTLFVGTGAIALYTGANAFLIGLAVPAGQVALFAASEKIVRAGNRVLALMASAVYPRVSVLIDRGNVARANRLSLLAFSVFVGTGFLSAAVLAGFASPIIKLVFGPGFEASVPLLRILALLLPLNIIGVALSTQYLLPRGRDRQVSTVVLAAAVLDAALVVPAAELSGIRLAAWALVAVEVFVMLGYLIALRRTRNLSATRNDAATMVNVGLANPEVGKTEPPAR